MPRTPASLCTSPATSSAASVVTAPVTHWTSGLKSPTRASTSQRSTSAKISPSNPYPRSRNPNPSLNQPQFPQPNLQPPRQTGPRSNRHRQSTQQLMLLRVFSIEAREPAMLSVRLCTLALNRTRKCPNQERCSRSLLGSPPTGLSFGVTPKRMPHSDSRSEANVASCPSSRLLLASR